MRVDLDEVIRAIYDADDEVEAYYYVPEERLVYRISGHFDGELFNDEDLDSDDLIALPDKYEIDQYGIMRDFAENYPEANTREWLVNSIKGKGAFRRFRAVLQRFYIADKWNEFEEEAYRAKAIAWCEEYGIEYGSENEEIRGMRIQKSKADDYRIVTVTDDNYRNITFMHADFLAFMNHEKADPDAAEEELQFYLDYAAMYAVSDKGRFIAYLICEEDDDLNVVEALYVKPEYRRKKVATKLFAQLAKDKDDIVFDVRPHCSEMFKFLQSIGYSTADTIRIRKKEDRDKETFTLQDTDLSF